MTTPEESPSKPSETRSDRWGEGRYQRSDPLDRVSLGAFLLLLGVIWVTTPNFAEEIRLFFSDIRLLEVAENIFIPAPRSNHPVLYGALAFLALAVGVTQIAVSVARLVIRSPPWRIARSVSAIVFYLGAGYVLLQLQREALGFSSFLAVFVILIGISIILRGVIMAILPRPKAPPQVPKAIG